MPTLNTFGTDTNGDWKIQNGTFSLVEDTEAIREQLIIRLNSYKGDFFLNLEEGIDYDNKVFGRKKIDLELETEFKKAIQNTQGVTEITEFNTELTGNRRFKIQFKVNTIFNESIESTQII